MRHPTSGFPLVLAASAALLLGGAALAGEGAGAGAGSLASGEEAARLLKEVAESGQKIVAAANSGGRWDLVTFAADAAEARKLTDTPDVQEGCPRVSFDGRWAAFVELARPRSYEQDTGQVGLVELATGARSKAEGLDRAESLAWSPDSKELAATWGSGERNRQGGVRIYSPETRKTRTICGDKVGISDIDWSGDGKYFVFGARESFGLSWQIMAMNADGSNIHQAAFAAKGGFCHAAFSRDNQVAANTNGKGLVVGRFDPEKPFDLRKEPAGDWRTLLDVRSNPHNHNPRWSLDGKYILWSRAGKNINARSLFVVRVSDGLYAPVGPKDLVVGTVDYDWIPAPRKDEPKSAPPPPAPQPPAADPNAPAGKN